MTKTYKYNATNPEGEFEEGIQEAESHEVLVADMEKEGYIGVCTTLLKDVAKHPPTPVQAHTEDAYADAMELLKLSGSSELMSTRFQKCVIDAANDVILKHLCPIMEVEGEYITDTDKITPEDLE